ncbi:NAC domain-containing protein 17 isoform X2 [Cannabis sativa]|uniref:NAC domain-containing protein 17 isoform X2 n=1 Tax=Cannabis sativa TaxID=3483 RepID=UPI0011DF1336|nr:NAC domain-containing protein 17 isoform X2 [Cannabis sativa]
MPFSDDQDCPPGFRFYPTDEELVLYYLKGKICGKRLRVNVIGETDVYKFEPEELPGMSILKTGDRQWFFFSPRDRKHPNGSRSNRGTKHGYWKVTGKNRSITSTTRSVGVKKTLVFYKGHAPKGERTDWVMHEYTLDEEELKRCQNLQDYYALYKVFKKSGLGPKNGEQYGAPFREEEWNADCPDFNRSAIVETPVERVDEALSNVESQETIVDSQKSLSDEIEELLQQMTDEPLLDLPEVKDYANNTPPQSQVLSNNDMQSNLVDSLSREISFEEPVDSFHVSGVQNNVQANFEQTHSDISQLQFHVPSEVAFSPNIYEQEVYVLPVEDFIEMDDLFGPEPTTTDAEKPLENFQFEEVDGLSELDLFHDATMFLNDIGADDDQSRISHQYVHSLEQNVVNSYQYRRSSEQVGEDEVVSQLLFEVADQNTNLYYLQGSDQHTSLLRLEGTGQVNNQMYLEGTDPINNLLYQDIANQMNHQYQFQPDNQERSAFNSAEFDPGSHPDPSSVCDTSTFSLQPTQNQSGNDNNGNNSWFSSTLWSFVESIPTTPASAAENALVNRAFERMSSFSRLRINAAVNATTVPAGSDSETVKSSLRNRGFIFFPILVVIIAILWVVLGTVKLWGSSSSNSSSIAS